MAIKGFFSAVCIRFCSLLCLPGLRLADCPASNLQTHPEAHFRALLGTYQPCHSFGAHPGALGAIGIEGRAGWGRGPGMLAAVAMDLADVSEMPFKLARGPPRCMYGLEGGREGRRRGGRGGGGPRILEQLRK